MIERLIEWCAKNRFLVFLLVGLSAGWGLWALNQVPLDAIPDLSDVQVIVFTEWPGRSPDLVEDQISYPIITTMLAAPRVKFVRGQSFFGLSFVNVIFEDGTDMYWARSRVLEYLNEAAAQLPEGVTPILGPDATGVGWVYQYALVDTTGHHDLAELRSFQDWYLKYWLEAVPGVAEVASVGGYVKQYQVHLDPNALLAYDLPVNRIIRAIRRSNNDVGGRTVEFGGAEYMVRGRGYIRSVEDLELIPVGTDGRGTPVLLRDVARVGLGPDLRRGIAELDGKGEVVGGAVVMRYGENALQVIDRVKARIEEIRPGLPDGVEIVTTYDRSDLIHRAIETLKEKLVEESLVVALVAVVFLFHLPSALVPILILPVAILLAFIPMNALGLTSNIMSLGGIAIAIGAMVDAAIVMIENGHKRLEEWEDRGRPGSRREVVIRAAREVGRPLFFSLLIITVSFLPVFTLEAQEGRLFKPLAYTKTFAMGFAALLSVTLAPTLMVLLIRGRIRREQANPVTRFLLWAYGPVARFALRYRWPVLGTAALLGLATVPVFRSLGSEFMPPLNEGTILYMPTTVPGLSPTEAVTILQQQDRILASFPEVERVFGKIGRERSATDPAPLSMVETVVTLKPPSEWRDGLDWDGLIAEMDRALQFPGMPNIWWMPIQTRTEMLATGIRANLGIKVFGADLGTIQAIGERIERLVSTIPGTRSAFAERATEGYFIDFTVNRLPAARYGLTVEDVMDLVETAIGGKTVAWTVEGRERYPINVRYARELRDDLDELARVLVPTPTGTQVPMGQLARIEVVQGPPQIRDENGQLMAFVTVDVAGRDIGSYVEEAKALLAQNLDLPTGYRLEWGGQYQYLERARARLRLVAPLTLLIIFLLLYLNFRSVAKSLLVLLSVPFSLVGAIWLLWVLDYNLSVAVWVGIIALAGVAAEIGVVMIIYLDEAYERWRREGRLREPSDLLSAVIEGASKRVRPILMTVAAVIGGLLPIMWSTGTGADVMKRIAAPMVGGMVTTIILGLLVVPGLYLIWRGWELSRAGPIVKEPGEEGGMDPM